VFAGCIERNHIKKKKLKKNCPVYRYVGINGLSRYLHAIDINKCSHC